MMPNHLSIRTTLDHVLTILRVDDESQRERMVDEVEQVIQTKAMLLSLATLPKDDRQNFSKLPPRQVMDLLREHISEETITRTLQESAEAIIPGYIVELAQTATSEQKQAIEKLLAGVV